MANTPKTDRQHARRLVIECEALVDYLNETYPAERLPDLNATDREIGEWIGQRKLLRHLNVLRDEARKPSNGELPRVIGG